MRIMLTVLFIALQVLDVWSTRSILARGGRERNPVMRALMRVCGRWWWVPKLGFAIPCGVYLGFVDGWEGPALLVLCNLLYIWVVWNNMRQFPQGRRALTALRLPQ